MNKCDKAEVQYLGDLPIDNLDKLPEYFLAERDVMDEPTGDTVRSIVRVPSGVIFPSVQTDNVFALEPNNTAIEVPENQVRAVRIVNEVSVVTMQYADEDHAPMMLALGKAGDLMLCQNCGVVNIPEGHDYNIGQQYNVGEEGEPVVGGDGAKLFIPISRTKLLISL